MCTIICKVHCMFDDYKNKVKRNKEIGKKESASNFSISMLQRVTCNLQYYFSWLVESHMCQEYYQLNILNPRLWLCYLAQTFNKKLLKETPKRHRQENK